MGISWIASLNKQWNTLYLKRNMAQGSYEYPTCSDCKRSLQETQSSLHTEHLLRWWWASWSNRWNDCGSAKQRWQWIQWVLTSTAPYESCSWSEQYCAPHGMMWTLQIHNRTSSFLPETAMVYLLSSAWLFLTNLNSWQEKPLLQACLLWNVASRILQGRFCILVGTQGRQGRIARILSLS